MPELLLRVRDAGDGDDGTSSVGVTPARPRDVVASVDADHRAGELAVEVAEHLGRPLAPAQALLGIVRTGRVAHPDDLLGDLDLLSGDEIVLGAAAAGLLPPPRVPDRAWALDVTAGPDSGRSFVLQHGTAFVGRNSSADVVLGDRSVSRRHAALTLGPDGTLTLTADASAANGVTVDGEAVTPAEPRSITAGAVVGLGGTRAVVRRFERCPGERVDRMSQVEFHRTPYRPPIVADRTPSPVGPIPERPEPRRVQLIAVVAPLIAGVAMYAMTRQTQFLLFTLISPVVMIGTAIDDRRSGRRNFRGQVAAFRSMLADRREEFERLRALERAERLRAAPDVADLVRRAELRTIDLWERGRDAPDFLRVRIGLGDDVVSFPVELERDGDDVLRAEAREALAGVDALAHVPVTVDLADELLGVHGDTDLVAGVGASLALQIATLHSPDDVTVVTAVGPERCLGWMKWLPHLRSVTSPVGGCHIASDAAEADALVGQLLEVAVFRASDERSRDVWHWPRVVAFLDAGLRPDPASLARLLDLAGAACISVVWLASNAAEVPRQASRVLAVRHGVGARMEGHLWATDPTVDGRRVEVEHVREAVAERAARSLAPVRDASTASLATSIPRTAPLLDVLGTDELTASRIATQWQRAAPRIGPGHAAHHLRLPIGVAADGPLELDLVADGPHTLIGGTSGSGKSELLQTMVAALAANHSPERLNFLFVDYKGGASSQVFERLPHTVGYVTNLSNDLSVRALTSLRAELDRRMSLMEGRAKDLAELLERYPHEAPASLVIVVDEFATLVKEVPEFVAGVVDIAQRGRSLGIHLVLATQRPSGSVNENILANTNLRISLRVLDRSESTAILDSPDAAAIPVPLRGRGLVRLGPRRLVEFQSGFAGAPLRTGDERHPLRVSDFDRPGDTPSAVEAVERSDATHLDAVLDAIAGADDALALPRPRRPWRDVLPDVITLDSIWDATGESAAIDLGRHVVVGMLDQPEIQDQRPAIIDLEESGGLLIHGSGGTGKTTALRTIAAGLDRRCGGVATMVFDFASRGLTPLRALPSVVDVATGDDLEAVTRHLLCLDAELDRRRRLLAQHGAEHLTAFRRDHPHEWLERIVVLIDGFGGLAAALLDVGGSVATSGGADHWSDIVHRVIVDGRQVGIHAVITTDRRNVVPPRLQSSIGSRLVLRHADPQSYADLGIRSDAAAGLDTTAGRALLDGRVTVQIATVSPDPTARGQSAAIAAIAEGRATAAPYALASAALPESVTDHHLDGASDAAGEAAVAIGVADISLAPAMVGIEWSHAAVVGPARSGRSTALAAFLRGTADATGLGDVYVVGPAASPLARLDLPTSRAAFGRADVVGALLDRVANLAVVAAPEERIVLVADDVDALDDPVLAPVWERLVACDAVRIVGGLETRAMVGYTTNAAVSELRRARRMLVLQPDDPSEFLQLSGVKLPTRPGLAMVPGRGVLLVDRHPSIVHVAQRSTPAHHPATPTFA